MYLVAAACAASAVLELIRCSQGLMENAIYGGRIDNEFDARTLHAYLLKFFTGYGGANKIMAVHCIWLRVCVSCHAASWCKPGEESRCTGKSRCRSPRTTQSMYTRVLQEVPLWAHVCAGCRYRELVASLPDTDEPALFTLPANIERSVQVREGGGVLVCTSSSVCSRRACLILQRARSGRVVGQLKILRAAASEADAFDREKCVARAVGVLRSALPRFTDMMDGPRLVGGRRAWGRCWTCGPSCARTLDFRPRQRPAAASQSRVTAGPARASRCTSLPLWSRRVGRCCRRRRGTSVHAFIARTCHLYPDVREAARSACGRGAAGGLLLRVCCCCCCC
jgi:hypothetical protein